MKNDDVSPFSQFSAEMHRSLCQSHTEYATSEDVSVLIGSWNVNAKEEDSENMSLWLDPLEVQSADLVVIGLQEVIELSPTNTVIGSSYSGSSENSSGISVNSCEKWLSKLLAHFNVHAFREATDLDRKNASDVHNSSDSSFSLLESLSMVGIAIFVFARQRLRPLVRDIQVCWGKD